MEWRPAHAQQIQQTRKKFNEDLDAKYKYVANDTPDGDDDDNDDDDNDDDAHYNSGDLRPYNLQL